jgi:aminoglycoside phosphotransferase (APT) family kinase protein
MFSNGDSLEVFSFVDPGHPFFPMIQQFRTTVRTASEFRDFAGTGSAAGSEVHAEIKAEIGPEGAWRLARAYWCLQRPGALDGGATLRADTIYYKAGAPGSVVSFPDDPSLRTLTRFCARSAAAGERLEVLRYVPLRRLTFRRHSSDASVPVRIGKLKRRSKARESYDRLCAVHRAADRSRAAFTVARPLAFDDTDCVFYQSSLAGRSLVAGLPAGDAPHCLRRVGAVHAQLHGLQVDALAGWDLGKYRATISEDVEWIRLFRPEAAARLQAVLLTLDKTAPASVGENRAFCHGDFIPSQLLGDGDRIAVTDFDAARSGDRYQEMGKLLASLKYDLPHLRQALFEDGDLRAADTGELEQAYLEGYAAAGGAKPDANRLAWFRNCAEIHYLAMSLKKDAYARDVFERTVDAVVARAAGLKDCRS